MEFLKCLFFFPFINSEVQNQTQNLVLAQLVQAEVAKPFSISKYLSSFIYLRALDLCQGVRLWVIGKCFVGMIPKPFAVYLHSICSTLAVKDRFLLFQSLLSIKYSSKPSCNERCHILILPMQGTLSSREKLQRIRSSGKPNSSDIYRDEHRVSQFD